MTLNMFKFDEIDLSLFKIKKNQRKGHHQYFRFEAIFSSYLFFQSWGQNGAILEILLSCFGQLACEPNQPNYSQTWSRWWLDWIRFESN